MASTSDSRSSGYKNPNQKPKAPSSAELNSKQSCEKTNVQLVAEQEKSEISTAMAIENISTHNYDKMASTSDGHYYTNMKPNQISKATTDGEQKKEHSYEKTNVKLGAAVEKTGDADAMGKMFRCAH